MKHLEYTYKYQGQSLEKYRWVSPHSNNNTSNKENYNYCYKKENTELHQCVKFYLFCGLQVCSDRYFVLVLTGLVLAYVLLRSSVSILTMFGDHFVAAVAQEINKPDFE